MKSAIQQGFHFASDGIRNAAYIEAATIQEAEAIYKKLTEPDEPEPELPADNS